MPNVKISIGTQGKGPNVDPLISGRNDPDRFPVNDVRIERLVADRFDALPDDFVQGVAEAVEFCQGIVEFFCNVGIRKRKRVRCPGRVCDRIKNSPSSWDLFRRCCDGGAL